MATTHTREPTVWTIRLQWATAVFSVFATMGTAVILGYVTPETLLARTEIAPDDVSAFLLPFRIVGVVFLFANAAGILALWGKAWIFYLALVTNAVQGVGFVTADLDTWGLRGLATVGHYVADGGGGVLAVALLTSLVVYRTAWAHRRVRRDGADDAAAAGEQADYLATARDPDR